MTWERGTHYLKAENQILNSREQAIVKKRYLGRNYFMKKYTINIKLKTGDAISINSNTLIVSHEHLITTRDRDEDIPMEDIKELMIKVNL